MSNDEKNALLGTIIEYGESCKLEGRAQGFVNVTKSMLRVGKCTEVNLRQAIETYADAQQSTDHSFEKIKNFFPE